MGKGPCLPAPAPPPQDAFLPLPLPPLSFFGSRSIFRVVAAENPVPRSFFAPKLNGKLSTQANKYITVLLNFNFILKVTELSYLSKFHKLYALF